jgi:hypothetical protein
MAAPLARVARSTAVGMRAKDFMAIGLLGKTQRKSSPGISREKSEYVAGTSCGASCKEKVKENKRLERAFYTPCRRPWACAAVS